VTTMVAGERIPDFALTAVQQRRPFHRQATAVKHKHGHGTRLLNCSLLFCAIKTLIRAIYTWVDRIGLLDMV